MGPRTVLLQCPCLSLLWYSSSSVTMKSEETVNQTHKEREGVNVEDTHANFYVICTYDPFLLFTSMFLRR